MSELSEKQRDNLDEDQFAFPKERKEPLNNASHVRNAIARFDQVEGRQRRRARRGVEADQEGRREVRRRGQREELARAREEKELTVLLRRQGVLKQFCPSDELRATGPQPSPGSLREQPQRVLDVALERLHEARRVPAVDDAVVAASDRFMRLRTSISSSIGDELVLDLVDGDDRDLGRVDDRASR